MPDTVIGISLDESSICAAVIDRAGTIRARASEVLEPSSTTQQVLSLLRRISEKNHVHPEAIGIAAAGKISASEGALRARLRCPVVVDQSRHAAVLGEIWRGEARGKPDVVLLEAGSSVTAGIVTEGCLLRGNKGLAGSAAWMVVSEADGFEVRKYGGLESVASAPAIVRAARNAVEAGFGANLAEYDLEALTADDIAELARRGNLACRQIYRRVGKSLGLAAANLISLFNPEIVIISGELTLASDLFWDELTETALTRCQPLSAPSVRIRLSTLRADAKLYGAAHMAWQAIRTGKSTAKSRPTGKATSKPRIRK